MPCACSLAGCNSFKLVPEGAGDIQVLIEPRKTCKKQGDPFCECYPLGSTMGQPWCAPDGCLKAWTDGCNDYTVSWPGVLSEMLPLKTCVWEGVPACKDMPVTPPRASETPVCTGRQVFSDCMPCPNMCGGTGPEVCPMVCKSGCSCPSGAWTGSDGTCYMNKTCTELAAKTGGSEEETEAEPEARGSEAVVVGAVSAAACLVVFIVALVVYRRRHSGAAGAAPAAAKELRPNSDNDL